MDLHDPAVDYTIRPRYPRHLTYQAELACSLIDPTTQAVRWDRNLDQQYEETVVFNTMTKLPARHERVLLRECVVPLWDAMACGCSWIDLP